MPRWSIKINANPQGPATFSPQTQQAYKGDLISWANNDNANSHWPAPIQNGVTNPTGWLSEAIPPNASSKQSLTPSTNGTFNYRCYLHPNEAGVIQVASLVTINISANPTPTPDAPGAFASPTSAQVGDIVFWANNDSNEHQPMPAVGGGATTWFSAPIGPGQTAAAGQTQGTKTPTSATGTVNYVCAIHPNEKGVIQVAVSINTNTNPTPTQNAPASFFPSTAQTSVNATLSWTNNDSNQHQPMPVGGSATDWFAAPIAAGQTKSSSKAISSAKGTVNYVCALHPGETGVINVS